MRNKETKIGVEKIYPRVISNFRIIYSSIILNIAIYFVLRDCSALAQEITSSSIVLADFSCKG